MAPDAVVTDAGELKARAQGLVPLLADRLVAWQRSAGRHHLPWQQTRDPYRVWLSEIMLQQTQVSTVQRYYLKFLSVFPTVQALAAADLDDVLALWAGLGYYSRARNLHRCAQVVCERHHGSFPSASAALQDLPGIGPSTAAAIAAFCFDERVSIMDGNVRRVLSRVLAWGGDLSVRAHEKALNEAAQQLVPQDSRAMPAYTQGLMDLGATLCLPRKPDCPACPWSDLCGARSMDVTHSLPRKTRKLRRGIRENWWVCVQADGAVWLEAMPETGVWGGLWNFPMAESEATLQQALQREQAEVEVCPSIKHVLTHLDWLLHPVRVTVASREQGRRLAASLTGADARGKWVNLTTVDSVGVPAPLKQFLLG
jgi:A/G-specific adenine glycosylase